MPHAIGLLIFKSVPAYSWLATSEHWGHFQYADRDRGLVGAMFMYAVSSENCGNQTVSNGNATLYWDRGGSNSTSAYLDIIRVDNAWDQKGCFSLGNYVLRNRFVSVPSSYTIPSNNRDYDSLYVVRMRWYSQGRYFYGSDCYFTLQPSEYIVVTGQCAFAAGLPLHDQHAVPG